MTDFFEYLAAVEAGQFKNTPSMHRKVDHATSIDASERIAKSCKTELQSAILEKLIELGPMTDGELENLPVFSHYGPSTVRKRRSELFQDGKVEKTDAVKARMTVWRAAK